MIRLNSLLGCIDFRNSMHSTALTMVQVIWRHIWCAAFLLLCAAAVPAFSQVPTLTFVSPASGPLTGGTQVTLTGTQFAAGATVTVGGVAATGCAVFSSTQMTCTTPAGTVGAKNVVLTQAGGSVTWAYMPLDFRV